MYERRSNLHAPDCLKISTPYNDDFDKILSGNMAMINFKAFNFNVFAKLD